MPSSSGTDSSAAPPEDARFEPVRDRHGLRLALVFQNHAPEGLCPWYRAGRCHHCDIGAGEGAAGTVASNRRRLAWLEARYADVLPRVAHLVLYDSGSVLNPRELPAELLDELVAGFAALPALRVLSLDSREPFVQAARLEGLARVAGERVEVRPILGLETADDARRDLLDKRMAARMVRRAFDEVGAAARALGPGRVGLDVNVVVGGPGTTPATAVADAVATARHAWSEGARVGATVDLNVHPYYPSRRGRARFPDHPRCDLPTAAAALRALADLRVELAAPGGVYVGWQDEGHDQERDVRRRTILAARAALDAFNATQDPAALDGL